MKDFVILLAAGIISIFIIPKNKQTTYLDTNKIVVENINYQNKLYNEKKAHLLDSLSSSGDSCYITNVAFNKGPITAIPIKEGIDSVYTASKYSTTYSLVCTPKKHP